MALFNSYVTVITRGETSIFLWFSYGFPMVLLWFFLCFERVGISLPFEGAGSESGATLGPRHAEGWGVPPPGLDGFMENPWNSWVLIGEPSPVCGLNLGYLGE